MAVEEWGFNVGIVGMNRVLFLNIYIYIFFWIISVIFDYSEYL